MRTIKIKDVLNRTMKIYCGGGFCRIDRLHTLSINIKNEWWLMLFKFNAKQTRRLAASLNKAADELEGEKTNEPQKR